MLPLVHPQAHEAGRFIASSSILCDALITHKCYRILMLWLSLSSSLVVAVVL